MILVLRFGMDSKNIFFCCAFAYADRNFLPFAVSIRSMIEKVKNALETKHTPPMLKSVGIKIPSRGDVGMQFAPKAKTSSKALSYTC